MFIYADKDCTGTGQDRKEFFFYSSSFYVNPSNLFSFPLSFKHVLLNNIINNKYMFVIVRYVHLIL